MGTKEKLISRFLNFPKVFGFSELETLLNNFGYVKNNKGKTSGSGVSFLNEETGFVINLHKPHDGIMKNYAMKQVYTELLEFGYISNKEKNEK